jgi:hypothetical protein
MSRHLVCKLRALLDFLSQIAKVKISWELKIKTLQKNKGGKNEYSRSKGYGLARFRHFGS